MIVGLASVGRGASRANCLGAAGRNVEVDRRDGPDWGVIGRDDRGPKRARCGVVVVPAVIGGGDVNGRQKLAGFERLYQHPTAAVVGTAVERLDKMTVQIEVVKM